MIGQDWTDTLDARAAGLVRGFAAHGAPVETADVAPSDRQPVDVEHFVGVELPTGDWRDQRIAELQNQLARVTGAPIDPRDQRIADLQYQISQAAAGRSDAAAKDTTISELQGAVDTATAPPATPPADLPDGATPPATEEELAVLRSQLEQMGAELDAWRTGHTPPPEADVTGPAGPTEGQ